MRAYHIQISLKLDKKQESEFFFAIFHDLVWY